MNREQIVYVVVSIALLHAFPADGQTNATQPLSTAAEEYLFNTLFEEFRPEYQNWHTCTGRSRQFAVMTFGRPDVNELSPQDEGSAHPFRDSFVRPGVYQASRNYYAAAPQTRENGQQVHAESQLPIVFSNMLNAWGSDPTKTLPTDVYIVSYYNPCVTICASELRDLALSNPTVNFHIGYIEVHPNANVQTGVEGILGQASNIQFGRLARFCADHPVRRKRGVVDCSVVCNVCTSQPCQNGGTCSNQENGFRCDCRINYGGHECERSIPCESSPCLHEGVCYARNNVVGYTCRCPTSYTGYRCQTYLHCSSSPCQNGGTCHNEPNSFRCECSSQFDGDYCETYLHCSSSPCQNGGTCHNENGGYRCECPSNYVGSRCQTDKPTCFASSSIVRVKHESNDGTVEIQEKRLDQLKVGEHVESFDRETKSVVYSEVYYITHAQDQSNHRLLKLILGFNKGKEVSLRLHPKHLVYACAVDASACLSPPTIPITAESVKIGDFVWVKNSVGEFHPTPVLDIGESWDGIRHPMTLNHVIIVDDVLASVHMYDEELYRQVTSPLRYLYGINPSITNSTLVKQMVEMWDLVEENWL